MNLKQINKQKNKQNNKLLFICIFILIAIYPQTSQSQALQVAKNQCIKNTVNKLNLSALQQNAGLKVEAAIEMLNCEEVTEANNILKKISFEKLTKEQKINFKIANAKILSSKRKYKEAIQEIQFIARALNNSNLDNQKVEVMLLLANAYERENNYLKAAKQLYFIQRINKYYNINKYRNNKNNNIFNNINSTSEFMHNTYRRLWSNLVKISSKELEREIKNNIEENFKAWLELALINRKSLKADKLLIELINFKSRYPNHPATKLINETNQELIQLKKIALLLPSKGEFAEAAKVIQKGFMTAYYKSQSHKGLEVIIYDSSDNNIISLYNKAVEDGADLIVGPLSKDNVQKILDAPYRRINTPIIALNSIEGEYNAKVFQFGLNPENEAQLLAQRAFVNNYNNIAIISSIEESSKRAATAFEEKWSELKNKPPKVKLELNPAENPEKKLRELLGFTDSEQTSKSITDIIKNFIKHKPRTRNDIDLIVFLVDASLAKSLKPLLNFFYAGDIQVYSNPKAISASSLKDLNDVIYCDMPWMLTNRPDVLAKRNVIKKLWPASHKELPQLFSFGADAYYLAININKLRLFPGANYQGVTGNLKLDENLKLQRQLNFAKIIDGKSILLKK